MESPQHVVTDLVSRAESFRDEKWESLFLENFAETLIEVVSDQAKPGPDGWPYLFVQTGPGATEPVARVAKWLAGRGIGLVLNAHKVVPDYVFTYGMIWHFRETGHFLTNDRSRPHSQAVYDPEQKWIFGEPTPTYLPKDVRGILREFFAAQKVTMPKILGGTSPDFKQTDLIWSVESLGSPENRDHARIAEAISWFLPAHYSVVLASEKGLPPFFEL